MAGTEEWYEKNYGEWLALMAEDLGGEMEPPTDEELEELYYARKNENISG